MKTVEGTVDRITMTGICLDGKWANRSKFSLIPNYEDVGAGDKIKLFLDDKDFIQRIFILEVAK